MHWVIHPGYPPGLSTCFIHPGYPPGLSTQVILPGYLPGLSIWVICLGYPSELSVWVIHSGYPFGLSVQVIRLGYLPSYSSSYLMLPNLTNQFIKLSNGDLQCEWNLVFLRYCTSLKSIIKFEWNIQNSPPVNLNLCPDFKSLGTISLVSAFKNWPREQH